MPSSSMSVCRETRVGVSVKSPHDPLGACDPRGSIERYVLTLAGPKIKLPLDD
jgi:hypothetical protein